MLVVLYDSNASQTLNVESYTEVSDGRQKGDAVSTFKGKKFMYGFIVAFSVLSWEHGSLIYIADRLVL